LRAAIGHGPESTDDTKERVDGVVSGIAYSALCVTAVSILIGSGGGSGSPDKATGGVLDWPAGQVLVVIAGLIVIGVGLEQGYKGIKRKFLLRFAASRTVPHELLTVATGAGSHAQPFRASKLTRCASVTGSPFSTSTPAGVESRLLAPAPAIASRCWRASSSS
jgi:hypothetical protein